MDLTPLLIVLAIGVVIATAVRHRRLRHQRAIDNDHYAAIAVSFVEWLSRLHEYGHDFSGQAAQDVYALHADPLRGVSSLQHFWQIVGNSDAREQLVIMFGIHHDGACRSLRAGERQYLLTGR